MMLKINGRERHVEVAGDVPLLYVLRNDLAMVAPKYGCGQGMCGACAVLADGKAIRSCVTPVSSVADAAITTLHGPSDDPTLRALQQAFVAEQAAQCGYCSNGMIMTARVLLDANRAPTRDEVCAALDANLCRCGAHLRIIRAVQRAAGMLSR